MSLAEHLAENVVQDAAVLVVGDFERRVDASNGGEILFFTVCAMSANLHFLARLEIVGQAFDVENLEAGEPARFRSFARQKFQRQHSHSNEVAAMDALEAFGKDGADSEQNRALGGPVARRAGTIFLPG